MPPQDLRKLAWSTELANTIYEQIEQVAADKNVVMAAAQRGNLLMSSAVKIVSAAMAPAPVACASLVKRSWSESAAASAAVIARIVEATSSSTRSRASAVKVTSQPHDVAVCGSVSAEGDSAATS